MSKNKVDEDDKFYRFVCPHCSIDIEVQKNQLNCKIFRCGIFKNNGKQMNPHTNKLECERLMDQKKGAFSIQIFWQQPKHSKHLRQVHILSQWEMPRGYQHSIAQQLLVCPCHLSSKKIQM